MQDCFSGFLAITRLKKVGWDKPVFTCAHVSDVPPLFAVVKDFNNVAGVDGQLFAVLGSIPFDDPHVPHAGRRRQRWGGGAGATGGTSRPQRVSV